MATVRHNALASCRAGMPVLKDQYEAGARASDLARGGRGRHAGYRAAIGGLAVSLLALAGSAHGQAAPAPQKSGEGVATIKGIVVDSIHGGPLVGAAVTVEGALGGAMTDSMGRFRVDSVEPGQRRLGVFHPLLDSLGVGITSPPLTLKGGDTLLVGLATPSAVTVVDRFCRSASTPADGQTGPVLLKGQILDADSDTPVAGIHVSVSWVRRDVSAVGVHRVLVTRDTTTTANGVFNFCHLPPGLKVLIRATRAPRGDTSSASDIVDRQYDIGGQRVGIVALHVPAASVASTPAASAGVASLSGRIIHANGSPAVAARVLVIGGADSALTSDSGGFVLHGLRPGTRTLVVRAVGYVPVSTSVEVSGREMRNVVVPLGMQIAVLDSIKIIGQLKSGYVKVGFQQRRQNGTGHFMTAEDLAKLQATEFLDLLTTTPGVRVAYGRNGDEFLVGTRGGGGCVSYVIDGAPYRELVRGDINSFLEPDEVGAIEVYDPTQTPGPFMGSGMGPSATTMTARGRPGLTTGAGSMSPSTGGCMVVVVWTKAALGVF